MKIIKHGNTHKEIETKCPHCECIFSYEDREIEEEWERIDAYNSDHKYDYVKCPDCGKQVIVVKDRSNYVCC